jgi:L-histidine N-alpha-methyltransferase
VDFKIVQANFLDELYQLGPGGDRLILFLAGTLGNLHPDKVPGFLTMVAEVMEPGDRFLLGVDLIKDRTMLEAAYNDRAGVTEAFNKNILKVINTRFGANFDPELYEHRAFYDPDQKWIEMRLRSLQDHKVRIPAADLALNMKKGQELRTELSCKYTRRTLEDRAHGTGLTIERWTTDPNELFALALLQLQ